MKNIKDKTVEKSNPIKREPRYRGKSGKFDSMRHFWDVKLPLNPGMRYEEAIKLLKKEFPDNVERFTRLNFAWYKHKIINKGEVKNR